MRTLPKALWLAAFLAVAAACADSSTGLQSEDAAAFESAKVELAAVAATLPDANHRDPSTAPPPLLARLTGRALERLENAGADDARARMVTELRTRHEALRTAIEGGSPR